MIFIISLLIFFFLLALWDWSVNKDYYETNYMILPYATFLIEGIRVGEGFARISFEDKKLDIKLNAEIPEITLSQIREKYYMRSLADNNNMEVIKCKIIKENLTKSLNSLFMQEKGKPHITDIVNKCVTIKPSRLNKKEKS